MKTATERAGIDETNKSPCDANGNRCALMTAVLNEKNGQITKAFSFATLEESVVFNFRKRGTPYLVMVCCPFCGQRLEPKKSKGKSK